MKIGFRAKFSDKETYKDIYDEERLSDSFLIFLPSKLEITPLKADSSYASTRGRYYEIRMETGKLFTMEEIKEKLRRMEITMKNISHIKREFSKEELEEVKKLVCFKEIFQPTELKK